MGQEPKKYHITDDGKIYEVENDGSVTKLGEVADLNKQNGKEKGENIDGEKQHPLKNNNDNRRRDNKKAGEKGKANKKKIIWRLLLVFIIIASGIVLLKCTGLSFNRENSMSPSDSTFINTQAFPADTTNMEIVWVNKTPIYLRHIKGGNFKGRIQNESVDGQKFLVPEQEWEQYDMHVNDFTISLTEVTQELWEAVMNESFSSYLNRISKEDGDEKVDMGIGNELPVYYIDLPDAKNFIDKLNDITGRHFRLPTSTEWVYAQMGGVNTVKISDSDEIDKVAWYVRNNNGKVQKVATKLPNRLGLYDMIGNVQEWTTLYKDEYNTWSYPYDFELDDFDQCFLQNCWRMTGRDEHVGFRIVLD